MAYAGFGRKNVRAFIRKNSQIDALYPILSVFHKIVVCRTTMHALSYPVKAYAFFSDIPLPLPG